VATYQTQNGQLLTAGGYPTGLAAPSVPFSVYGTGSSTPLVGGRQVSFGELYRTQVWIAVNVNKITRQVSRLPLKVWRRTGDGTRERVRTGNLAELIDRPWRGAGQTHLKQAMMLPTLVHGNALIAKRRRRGAAGPIERLEPLLWQGYTPRLEATGGEVAAWEPDERSRGLDPEEVVHLAFRGLDGPVGVSPLEQLGVTVAIEDAAQRHQRAMLANGARPPSAVYAAEEFLGLEPGERQVLLDQLRADLTALYAGPEQQGRPALLPPGLKWERVGHTAVEAELIDQRKLSREEVAACYDMPQPVVGIMEHATLANWSEASRMLFTTSLAPWLTLAEDTLLAQLIAPEATIRGDVWAEFDLSDVLRGDLLKRAQALALQIAHGVLTIDEARELENRPMFRLPATSVPLYPANNLQPASQSPPPPSDGAVQEAAGAVAAMSGDDLRRVLRGAPSAVDAILELAHGDTSGTIEAVLSYASTNGYGNGHEETDA
jgi:HK97 family phage portal protein